MHEFGIEVSTPKVNWAQAVKRAHDIIQHCGEPKPEEMRALGVTLVHGEGALIDAHTVSVGNQRLSADQILIATGAHPPRLPIPGIEHALTHVEILRREEPPARLLIIGGGIIAFEFAYMFARLGTSVTLIEVADHVLSVVDWEVRAAVLEHARRLGINVHVSTQIDEIEHDAGNLRVSGQRPGERLALDCDCTLVLAAGQQPAIENLGLEKVGVALDHGIVTDGTLRTTVPNIWAAGDVRRGAHQLTMVAQHEGKIAAYNALHTPPRNIDESIVPWMIGTSPPIAGVGMTDQEARTAGRRVGSHKVEYSKVCPAANVMGEPDGIAKVIFDAETGMILGAHIFGAGAPELVQEIAFAMHGGMTLKQAGSTIFLFPSYSYVLQRLLSPQRGDPPTHV